MAKLDHGKVAAIYEAKGKYKEAADYYAAAGDKGEAFRLYENILLSKNPNMEIIRDIRGRLAKLDAPKELRELASKAKKRGLEKHFVFAALAITSFAMALFFTSFSLTGYATGGFFQESYRWFGLCLFACGLIFAFFYFKNKK